MLNHDRPISPDSNSPNIGQPSSISPKTTLADASVGVSSQSHFEEIARAFGDTVFKDGQIAKQELGFPLFGASISQTVTPLLAKVLIATQWIDYSSVNELKGLPEIASLQKHEDGIREEIRSNGQTLRLKEMLSQRLAMVAELPIYESIEIRQHNISRAGGSYIFYSKSLESGVALSLALSTHTLPELMSEEYRERTELQDIRSRYVDLYLHSCSIPDHQIGTIARYIYTIGLEKPEVKFEQNCLNISRNAVAHLRKEASMSEINTWIEQYAPQSPKRTHYINGFLSSFGKINLVDNVVAGTVIGGIASAATSSAVAIDIGLAVFGIFATADFFLNFNRTRKYLNRMTESAHAAQALTSRV